MESRTLYPLELIHDAPAPQDILDKLNAIATTTTTTLQQSPSIVRRPSDRKKSIPPISSTEELLQHSHSKKPSVDNDQEQIEIARSPEVNEMLSRMFGSEHDLSDVQQHEEQQPQQQQPAATSTASRFSKLAVGTSFVARKVQKTISASLSQKENIQPPPVPQRNASSNLVPSSSVEELNTNGKLKKLNENIGKYLEDYSKQHVHIKTELEDTAITDEQQHLEHHKVEHQEEHKQPQEHTAITSVKAETAVADVQQSILDREKTHTLYEQQ